MAKRICSIEGCQKPAEKRGWCAMHYRRWRVHGDPNITLRPSYGSGRVTSAKSGYVRIWRPGHPLASADGYVYEHRLAAYDAGLDVSGEVHHVNEDKTDNRQENLEGEHARRHIRERGWVRNQYGTWPVKPSG